ncbi:RNA polymerase sigma factor [Bradymonas sediminis]|uniref:RNA polymerase sigma factor n=1 Tax=Bradymonas sediminis TaxID=1548548 RepID=A0A2Z4FG57_9DELT|nr:sigma-70 family RNA polymerase sigma factor [Bradymonas sediminis]AWV87912.1 RNA polymerase subunit sigma [Bradymonas sediminis]TDP62929.1 RNA polymerase sigma-70 factor (ECF subfamily) [Bradymonas sediminis]
MISRPERQLIAALKKRDEDAFTELVTAYQQRVFNVVYRIVGDREESEDVAQEVFVAVFKYIDSFRGESKFSTWIYRIASNRALNRVKYLKRRSYKKHQDFEDTPDATLQASGTQNTMAQPDEHALGNELHTIINAGLATLSEEHRTVVVLRDVEDMSYTEIAEALEVAEGTVKSRLYRARAALKDYVATRYAPGAASAKKKNAGLTDTASKS